MKLPNLAVFFGLALAGCGGGGICADLTRQASDLVAAHQSCSVDADCAEAGYGFIYDMGADVSCWPGHVISKDAVPDFMSLMQQLSAAKCEGPSHLCSGLLVTTACNQGVCGVKTIR
jgi:hypothetical protein